MSQPGDSLVTLERGGGGLPRILADPPNPQVRKLFLRGKKKSIKRAREWGAISGKQTFVWLQTPPPPPPKGIVSTGH